MKREGDSSGQMRNPMAHCGNDFTPHQIYFLSLYLTSSYLDEMLIVAIRRAKLIKTLFIPIFLVTLL